MRDVANIGSTYRLMACLNFTEMVHVGTAGALGAGNLAAASSKGCEMFVNRQQYLLAEYLAYLGTHGPANRPPIVAVETASTAENIHTFDWPEDCSIMVGNEGTGVPTKVLKTLHPGYDKLVIIPMSGPHKSLNVAMALGMALFAYRRQWPGATLPMNM